LRLGGDPVEEVSGPGDPSLGADAGFQGQARSGSFGGLVGAAEPPGQSGQQAVDGAVAVGARADDGQLARAGNEPVPQPIEVVTRTAG
jgi:hypothetical protein